MLVLDKMGKNPIMTTQEVADFLHISCPTVVAMVRRGELRAARVGVQRRFLREDVRDLWENRE